MWQEYAHDYLDHVASSILRWGDSSKDAPKTLLTYEEWLVRTGRRRSWARTMTRDVTSWRNLAEAEAAHGPPGR